MEVALAALEIALSIALPLAAQRWDKARLPPAARARAWNTASWAAALYAFGPLSMLGWGYVTRRGLYGLALGAASAALLSALLVGFDRLARAALGLG